MTAPETPSLPPSVSTALTNGNGDGGTAATATATAQRRFEEQEARLAEQEAVIAAKDALLAEKEALLSARELDIIGLVQQVAMLSAEQTQPVQQETAAMHKTQQQQQAQVAAGRTGGIVGKDPARLPGFAAPAVYGSQPANSGN